MKLPDKKEPYGKKAFFWPTVGDRVYRGRRRLVEGGTPGCGSRTMRLLACISADEKLRQSEKLS